MHVNQEDHAMSLHLRIASLFDEMMIFLPTFGGIGITLSRFMDFAIGIELATVQMAQDHMGAMATQRSNFLRHRPCELLRIGILGRHTVKAIRNVTRLQPPTVGRAQNQRQVTGRMFDIPLGPKSAHDLPRGSRNQHPKRGGKKTEGFHENVDTRHCLAET